jgi:hypothetical protein
MWPQAIWGRCDADQVVGEQAVSVPIGAAAPPGAAAFGVTQ